MKKISLEQKQKVLDLISRGKNSPQIAALLGLSVWTVRKYRQRLKKGIHWYAKWVDQKVVT